MQSIKYFFSFPKALLFFFLPFFIVFSGCAGLGTQLGTKAPAENVQAENTGDQDQDAGQPEDVKESQVEVLPLEPPEGNIYKKSRDIIEAENLRDISSRLDKSLEFYQAAQDYWQQGELENALDSLDNAYALILDTPPSDEPKLSQQKDDLRFMISRRILEIYASRYTTVKGNHDAIPIVLNEHVKKEIELFTKGPARTFFIGSYKRSGLYRPYIVEELKKAGIPEELSWLPLVESGFKTKALSSARALGMWQFIASTGHKFGLQRDRYVDERLDPFKSTQAAIAYLKELHEIFGDWKTVLAAYNCGEGRVLHQIRNQNINYLDDFWDLYLQLPRETARYVPKFMATLHIVNNLGKYNMAHIQPDPPLCFEVVEVNKQTSLKNIADALEIDEEILVGLNPELRYKVLPEESYNLKIPDGKKEILLAKIDEIQEEYQSPHEILYHRVRPGETLSTIARRYNTTVKKIAWYNNIYRENYIVNGQVIKIPQAGAFAARGPISMPSRVVDYKVRRGDSLWVLAKRYNTTTKKIQELNNLNTVNLYIGQKLKIPAASSSGLKKYQVRQGDSPYKIAKRHDMNLNKLLKINELSRSSRIYPGQTIYVE
jgi:membrane-bound lytic murein transglycosylase D